MHISIFDVSNGDISGMLIRKEKVLDNVCKQLHDMQVLAELFCGNT